MRGLIRFLRRLRDREDGSPAAEFAFVAPILILMVIGTIEFGMIMFVTILMESGLRDAARYGITGNEFGGMSRMERIVQIMPNSMAPILILMVIGTIEFGIINDRTLGLVDISQADIQILVYPDFGQIGQGEDFVDGNGNGTYDVGETFTDANGNGLWDADIGQSGPGASGQVVLYRIDYGWDLLTPLAAPLIGQNGKFTLSASIAVRNEPWNQGGAT